MERLIQLLVECLYLFFVTFRVEPDRGAVRVRFGKYQKAFGPGIHFRLPFWLDKVFETVVVFQVLNLPNQSVVTKDGVKVAVSFTLAYKIFDVKAALLKVHDVDEAIQNIAIGVVAEEISERDWQTCRNLKKLAEDVHKIIAAKVNEFGVDVIEIKFTDMVDHKIIRLMLKDAPNRVAENIKV